MPQAQQLTAKRQGGYFVGAQFEPAVRQKQNIGDHYVLTYDIDVPTEELYLNLMQGATKLGDVEYVVYSTFSSTKQKKKLRVIVPLTEPVNKDLFVPLARIVGNLIDPGLECIDRVSFVDAQFMYWPAHLKDVKPIYCHNATGRVIDPDVIFNGFLNVGDYLDFTKLPHSPRESELRNAGEKAQDPTSKNNVVGFFCRKFDIHGAIAEFLSEVYTPFSKDAFGEVERYTYTLGTGVGAAIVLDNGLHLRSYHGSDPCGGKNVNSFDMTREHRYGHLDAKLDMDGVKSADLPSYKAMVEFIHKEYPEVTAELTALKYQFTEETIDDMFEAADVVDATVVEAPSAVIADEGEISLDVQPKYLDDPVQHPDWMKDLDTTAEGEIKSTLPNIRMILIYGSRFIGRFGFNEMTQEQVLLKSITSKRLGVFVKGPTEKNPVVPVDTQTLNAVRVILESPKGEGKFGYGMRVSDRDLEAAMDEACRRSPFHPIRDQLRSYVWDGVKRLDEVWIKTLHTKDTPYFRAVARLWFTAAVARIFEPGCKFDSAIMIEGPQGIKKSTLLRIIGGHRYTASVEADFDNTQKWVEATRGSWIIELPELVGFSKSDVNAMKKRMSDQFDRARMSYMKREGIFYRQSVMAGTTNDDRYLRDKTGNRRFLPVPCGPGEIDTQWMIDNREQVFAEAVQNYIDLKRRTHNTGGDLPLFLEDEDVVAEAKALQESRLVETGDSDIAGKIEHWLNTAVPRGHEKCGVVVTSETAFDPIEDEMVIRNMTCGWEIWDNALNREHDKYDQRVAQAIITPAMNTLSARWGRSPGKRACGIYGNQRTYIRKGTQGE